VVTNLVLQL